MNGFLDASICAMQSDWESRVIGREQVTSSIEVPEQQIDFSLGQLEGTSSSIQKIAPSLQGMFKLGCKDTQRNGISGGKVGTGGCGVIYKKMLWTLVERVELGSMYLVPDVSWEWRSKQSE